MNVWHGEKKYHELWALINNNWWEMVAFHKLIIIFCLSVQMSDRPIKGFCKSSAVGVKRLVKNRLFIRINGILYNKKLFTFWKICSLTILKSATCLSTQNLFSRRLYPKLYNTCVSAFTLICYLAFSVKIDKN